MYKCFDTKEIANTYKEYLKTNHWLMLKARMYNKYKYKCAYCSTNKDLNLHHKTYDNVGNERVKDLVYLCSNCHKLVHADKIKDTNLKLELKKKNARKNKKKPKKTPITIPDPPVPRPKTFLISTVNGGFSVISSREAASENFPQTIRIEMAYDVSSGNPFKKYTPLDFKLGSRNGIEIKLTKETGKLVRVQENVLRIEVDKLPFKLKVTGFDDNRDLKVKLTKEA